MRFHNLNGPLSVRAICGPHVVILAWDIQADWDAFTTGLLGFAIERSELHDGTVVERYFLRGIKRFEDKDKGLPPGTPVPTSEHPVQSFQWGDYTVAPERRYQYRIVPVYGLPKLLELRDPSAVMVEATTPAMPRASMPSTSIAAPRAHRLTPASSRAKSLTRRNPNRPK